MVEMGHYWCHLLLTAVRGITSSTVLTFFHLTFSVAVDDDDVADGSEVCEGFRTGEEESSSCD